MTKHLVAKIDELDVDTMKQVVVDGEVVCLAHAEDGSFYAIADTCTHEEYSLSEGELWGLDVECPAHGSRFNLRTGAVAGLPPGIPARTYPLTLAGGDGF